MKILLTHAYYLSEDPREQEIMKPYVPLGILYISAYLNKNEFPNHVYDSTFSDFNSHCNHIKNEVPAVIGIYVNLMTKLNVLRLIRFIRGEQRLSKTKIVLGGPEVKWSAENFIAEGADYVVYGEGEVTMLELCKALADGIMHPDKINGLVFHNGSEYVHTPARENIRDISSLPFPARTSVNLQIYFDAWKSRHGESAISVSTMRGCPYTCKWCSRAVYGQTYRRRDPQSVAAELKWITENYKVDTVWFVDDVFTISHKWMSSFKEALLAENVRIRYECITRSDRMSDEIIRLLKETGCFRVWIGAESGSQRIIDAMDRRVEVKQVAEMIRKTREAGMQAGTFIMVGYPGETEADIGETLQHLKHSNPDHYTVTVAYPIKGTPLYHETENDFIYPLPWNQGSDRQIDFRRTYPRKYYDYAIRWIANEVALHKNRINGGPISSRMVHRVKSVIARGGMAFRKYN